ncbi:unnamed protein product [Clonostachys rosea]|uniref:F-box domain-containing protein n=1 Tax=Bionectria ochroleuca TaxID=29856 RepID=A0ABY6UYP5_BIOOC|nr:unnamed protein product [Clonostachys rosea]
MPTDPDITNQAQDRSSLTTTQPSSMYPDREYVIHDSCLQFLEKTVHSSTFPLRRLYEVLASLPYSESYQTVDWGRDHGMHDVAEECSYDPWLARLSPDPEHPLRPYSTFDPLRSPQVDELLSKSAMGRSERVAGEASRLKTEIITAGDDQTNLSDRFLRLPTEICCLIAQYLPTTDVANIRLVSRAFLSSFDHQAFWASRFHQFHERSWLFEALDTTDRLDWRRLYDLTRYASIDKHLKNRRRIWELVPMILGTLQLRWHGSMNRTAPMEADHSLGVVVRCHKQRPGFDIREASRIHLLHKVSIPARLEQIRVSFTKLGDARYVCGFTFWPTDDSPCHMGYESPDQECVSLECFDGIILTTTKRGVRAVRFLSHTTTPWLGQTRGFTSYSKLFSERGVKRIEGGFDGCKMVSLAIPEAQSRSFTSTIVK